MASLKEAKKIWERNDESSAWEALSVLDESKMGKTETQALVTEIVEDALGSVKIENGKISVGKASPGETTGRLVFACSRHADCLKTAFTPEERVAVAEFLLGVNPTTSGVALGLKALSDFGMSSISVKQEKNSPTATIAISTLLDVPIKWSLGKGSSPLVSASGKPNEVKVTFDSKGKVAKVPVEIEMTNGAKHLVFLQFEVNATLNSARVILKEKATVKTEHTLGPYPATLDKALIVEKGETLEISVSITSGSTSMCPEQAFFGFINDNFQYVVPGSCSEKEVRAQISNNVKLADELRFNSGEYDLVLIASDERMSNPTHWKLAKAKLSLSPPPEKRHEALFTHHLLYESDTTLKALPEIHHQFRQPDRRAPWILAFVFSALQVGLLVALVANLLLLGFRPLDIFKSVRTMFFAGSLAFVEMVFAWYWVGPSSAPNMENLTYKYLPPLLLLLLAATRHVLPGNKGNTVQSNKKTGSL